MTDFEKYLDTFDMRYLDSYEDPDKLNELFEVAINNCEDNIDKYQKIIIKNSKITPYKGMAKKLIKFSKLMYKEIDKHDKLVGDHQDLFANVYEN